jgi:hypothetical protein
VASSLKSKVVRKLQEESHRVVRSRSKLGNEGVSQVARLDYTKALRIRRQDWEVGIEARHDGNSAWGM